MKLEDIKLLQLAAKAANYISVEPDEHKPIEGLMMVNWTIWNPLTKHGDALELSLDLVLEGKIRIQMQDDHIIIFENWDDVWVTHAYTMTEANSKKVFCNAIVNVAAEIGKKL